VHPSHCGYPLLFEKPPLNNRRALGPKRTKTRPFPNLMTPGGDPREDCKGPPPEPSDGACDTHDAGRNSDEEEDAASEGDPLDRPDIHWSSDNGGGSSPGSGRISCGAAAYGIVICCYTILLVVLLRVFANMMLDDEERYYGSRLASMTRHNTTLQNEVEASNPDLALYGYPHVLSSASSAGWLSSRQRMANGYNFSQDSNDEDEHHSMFGSDDGVICLEACAAKCRSMEAGAGGWDVDYEVCWCAHLDTKDLCREPCAEESYIDFSERPVVDADYCHRSVCDEDWFLGDGEYGGCDGCHFGSID